VARSFRDVRQRLQHVGPGVLPGALVRPLHRADVSVRRTLGLEPGLRGDLTSPNELLPPTLGVDDVAYSHLVLELPHREDIVHHRTPGIIRVQSGTYGLSVGILGDVPELIPTDRHDSCGGELSPFRSLRAGSVHPL